MAWKCVSSRPAECGSSPTTFGTFAEVTHQAGLTDLRKHLLGMTAGDYDHDGDLDLYLCGYVRFPTDDARHRPQVAGRPANWTNPVPYPAESNVLLRNEGDGTFTEVTSEAGVENSKGKSMQALFCDFDNDGWGDLYVCNDVATPDALYRNNGDGTFTNVAMEAGTYDFRAGMGVAIGDVWHRGWMDLLVTHWVAEDHALWKNVSARFKDKIPLAFDDLTPELGIGKPSAYVGWGCGLYDFDNDRHLDLLLVNGSTIEDELTADVLQDPRLLPQPAQAFWWDPEQQRFIELGEQAGRFFKERHVSRGAAFADYDDDGRMDVAIVHHGQPAQLLRNVSESGHWLKVKAAGSGKNRWGVGARVQVKAGDVTQTRELVCGSSYLSSDSLLVHFGLGTASQVDWVEIRFPSGVVRRVNGVSVDQTLTIHEDGGTRHET